MLVPGDSRQNKKIAAYFLSKGIKAIKFVEHDVEVVAVFDPNCVRVLPKTTNFDLHPFPDIVAGPGSASPLMRYWLSGPLGAAVELAGNVLSLHGVVCGVRRSCS
jgi:hypothetical protein